MKEIIEKLNKNGFEAYIVGGYVRDYLLGIQGNDIDICTNAPINSIMKIFKGRGKCFKEYFSYHIEENGFSYDITTYRTELKYKKNKPISIIKADTLEEDLKRRDFTINTFAIDNDGKLIDILNAMRDLNGKVIRTVGNAKDRFYEDKTRIVRALRFACTLDFELDKDIIDFIGSNDIKYLNEIPNEYKKKELDKIFDSGNTKKFFYYLNRYNIYKFFSIEPINNIKETYNRYGIYAQIECKLPFSNNEKNSINKIKLLVEKGDIGFNDIKKYSDEVIYNAASILGIENKIKLIKEVYNLHSIVDIDIDIDIMFRYVNIKNFVKVYKDIERKIIKGELINNRDYIEEYLKSIR